MKLIPSKEICRRTFISWYRSLYGHLNAASPDRPIILFSTRSTSSTTPTAARSSRGSARRRCRNTPSSWSHACPMRRMTTQSESHIGPSAWPVVTKLAVARCLVASRGPISLFDKWLPSAARRLSEANAEAIKARILPEVSRECRRPLYLRILFEECRLWPSYKETEVAELGRNVDELLKNLFDRLCGESNHGPTIERACRQRRFGPLRTN